MTEETPELAVRSLEPEVRRLWRTRRLPPPGGVLGPADGPIVRQFEGSFAPGSAPELVAQRAVAADVDARHLLLSGRGAVGTLRADGRPDGASAPGLPALLESLAVWVGGSGERPWDDVDRQAGIQGIVGRLAHREILVARDGPLRVCLSCRVPRTPERIIYQKEIGDTFLVRFPIAGTEPTVDALVWVDAPWRLLGASALLVHPDVPYCVVEYRRKGSSAVLLTSRGSIERLRSWMPDVELTVREERPGREWVGRAYTYPLRHEFPIGGSLDPPAGTIQADAEVGDTGTGIVPLVPGHGPTDAEIAERLGIAGWPLLTSRGQLDPTLMHKYSGLDLDTANEFVSRDLSEGGSVLARLRVVRGVPYCAVCGHRMVWTPGRAWCLEPARLPPEQRDRYARLLPHDRPITQIEVSRWPVSETTASSEPGAVALLECGRCERLEAPDGPTDCPCGGTRRRVNRRLLPSIAGAFGAWARNDPLGPADRVRIYANERRRAPAVVHQLAAMTGLDATSPEVGLTLLPTVSRIDPAQLVARHGADAVRSAFVRSGGPGAPTTTFEERCAQEEARLARFARRSEELRAQCGSDILREGGRPPDVSARDLEIEDRAILARWSRTHLRILAAYDRWQPEVAHRLIYRFLERDLLEYFSMTGPRLEFAGTPATKRAALRTLCYLFRSCAIALAPIAPFTAESVHRRLLLEPRSLFESVDLAPDRALANDDLAAAWDRWQLVIGAADGYRRTHGLPASTALPLVALVLPDEEAATKLRADRATLERLARITKLEVTSPQVPWTARQRRLVPVESEIRRAYPSLATQIVHLLERMPPRRTEEIAAREVTVFVNGVPRTITPEMLAAVDTLPEGFLPTPYGPGEMYVRSSGRSSAGRAPPPLSPDAFWVVRRLRRRLRSVGPPADPAGHVAIVAAVDPLAAELREKAEGLAEYLGLAELRVLATTPETASHARVEGRTRTGARWTVALPGVSPRHRPPKHRAPRPGSSRVPAPTGLAAPPEVDFADEKVIAREQSIRELGAELDQLFAAPLLGPAKLAIAWDAGLTSLDEFRNAPFERVAGLTGFGRPIAATLWAKFGRTAPAAPVRPHRAVAAGSSRRTVPGSRPAAPAAAPRPAVPTADALRPPVVEETAAIASQATAAAELPETELGGGFVREERAAPTGGPEPAEEAQEDLAPPIPTETPLAASEPGPPVTASADAQLESTPLSPEAEMNRAPELAPEDAREAELPPVSAVPSGPYELAVPTSTDVMTVNPPQVPAPIATPELPPSTGPAEAAGLSDLDATEKAALEPETLPTEGGGIPEPISEQPAQIPPREAPTPSMEPTEELPSEVAQPPAPEATPASREASEEVAFVPPELLTAPEPEPVPAGKPPVPPEPARTPPEPGERAALPTDLTDLVEEGASLEISPAPQPVPEPAESTSTEHEAARAEIPYLLPEPEAFEPTGPNAPEPTPSPPNEARTEGGEVETPEPADETASAEPVPPERGPIVEIAAPPVPSEVEEELPTPTQLEPGTPSPEAAVGSSEISSAIAEKPEGGAAPESAELGSPHEAPTTSPEAGAASGAEPTIPESEAISTVLPEAVPAPPPAEAVAPPPEHLPQPSPSPPTPAGPSMGPIRWSLVPQAPPPSAPPAPPTIASVPEPPPPPPSGVEIDFSSALFQALQPFLDATAAGHKGIALVRELPERIRVHIGPRPVEVYWLTNLQRPRTLRPSDLPALAQRIRTALEEEGVTALFIEGVEYLVGIHGIERVEGFVREIDTEARQRSARIWVHISPQLLSEADLERLVAACERRGADAPAPGEEPPAAPPSNSS